MSAWHARGMRHSANTTSLECFGSSRNRGVGNSEVELPLAASFALVAGTGARGRGHIAYRSMNNLDRLR
jgi:hypothetical protein